MKVSTLPHRTLPRLFRVIPALFLAVSLAGCASVPEASLHTNTTHQELQWPPLPQVPAIVWVKQVNSYLDVGITKGFWTKVAEFFAGARDESIGKPYGVYADRQGRLFVADVKRGFVHFMDVKNRRYREIGAGVFRTPIALAEDDRDHLYITDSSEGAVFTYNLDTGTLHRLSSFSISRPTGIALSPDSRSSIPALSSEERNPSRLYTYRIPSFSLATPSRYSIPG